MSKATKKPPKIHRLSLLGDWADIYLEMENTSARAKSIVATAFIENNLGLAIISRLRLFDDDDEKMLFEGRDSVLGNLSAKIDLGYFLNLYGEKVRADLHSIRKIRNKFSHELHVRTFDHAEVRDYCDKLIGTDLIDLQKGQTGPRTREQRFMDLAHHFGDRFSMDARLSYLPPPSPNKIGAHY